MVLPNLTDLRNVVSRLGHLAENIRISANQVSMCSVISLSRLEGLHNSTVTRWGS